MSGASPRRRARLAAAAMVAACSFITQRPARGQSAAPGVLVDRTAARFYAPEIGGTLYPRFVFQRTLAFEARLSAMAEIGEGIGDGYGERDVRDALDHHVAEEILSNLADRLIADAPPDKRPTTADLSSVEEDVSRALVERIGGRARLDRAARAEQLDAVEIQAILRRGAMAAWYIDRALTPILHPTEDQLRDVLRTSANPYRGRRFDEVREPLERWFLGERLRVVESAFLQAARSRVHIIVTP